MAYAMTLDVIDASLLSNKRSLQKHLVKGVNVYALDMFAIAAMQRLDSNAHAFRMMVETGNYPVACAVLRMQLDTAMRLNGISLVSNPRSAAMELLGGVAFRKMKDKRGRPLVDSMLKAELAKREPWVTTVYDRTSSMIHLSAAHIHHSLDYGGKEFSADGSLLVDMIVGPTNPTIPVELFAEVAEAFLHATQLALDLGNGLLHR